MQKAQEWKLLQHDNPVASTCYNYWFNSLTFCILASAKQRGIISHHSSAVGEEYRSLFITLWLNLVYEIDVGSCMIPVPKPTGSNVNSETQTTCSWFHVPSITKFPSVKGIAIQAVILLHDRKVHGHYGADNSTYRTMVLTTPVTSTMVLTTPIIRLNWMT